MLKPNITGLLASILMASSTYAQTITYQQPNSQSNLENRQIEIELAVGKTPTSQSVSQTGAYQYNIPIRIPKGTNGQQPNLSLNYSSQGGNGVAGYGWNIGGLSSITRVRRSFYHEGKTGNVKLIESDPLSLDGHRLINVEGNYGANGTTYKTEQENFAIVKGMGSFGNGHDWIQVETKGGHILEYGRTSDSKILSHDGLHVISWRLNRKIDRNGNYIDYSYTNNNEESHLSQVSYTGNLHNDQAPYVNVKFNYLDRSDENAYFMTEFGKQIKTAKILSSIEVIYGESERYKYYELKYSNEFYSYLEEVAEYGKLGSEERFNELKFSYEQKNHLYSESHTNVTMGSMDYFPADFNGDGLTDLLRANYVNNSYPRHYTNYELLINNGVGYDSPFNVALTTGEFHQPGLNSIITQESGHLSFNVGDFNGDQKADIAISSMGKTPNNCHLSSISIFYSNCYGVGSGSTKSFQAVSYPVPEFNKIPQQNCVIQGDFNGDGAEDLMFNLHDGLKRDFGVDEHNTHYGYIFAPNISPSFQSFHYANARERHKFSTKDFAYILDMNGDGKTDIMHIREHSSENKTVVRSATSQQGYYVEEVIYHDDHGTHSWGNFPNKDHEIKIADFNGDGKSDLLTSDKSDKNSWLVSISKGNGFLPSSQTLFLPESDFNDHLYIGDFNGDGRSDLISSSGNFSLGNAQQNIYYSKGYQSNGKILFQQESETFGQYIGGQLKAVLLDSDGDGALEMLAASTSQNVFIEGNYSTSNKYGLISAVSTGFNELTEIDYKAITERPVDPLEGCDDRIYTPTNDAIYPIVDFHVPLVVVSHLVQPDLTGNNGKQADVIDQFFHYKHAKFHKHGKGFLGFEVVRSAQKASAGNRPYLVNQQEYQIDNERFISYLSHSYSSFSPTFDPCNPNVLLGLNLQTVANHYSILPLTNNRFVLQLDGSTEADNIHGRTTSSSYNYSTLKQSEEGNPDYIEVILAPGTADEERTKSRYEYGQHGTYIPAHVVKKTTEREKIGQAITTDIKSFEYFGNGNLWKEHVLHPQNQTVELSKTFEYEGSYGLVTASHLSVNQVLSNGEVFMRDHSEYFQYDSLGRFLIQHTTPEGFTEKWQYEGLSGKKKFYDDIEPNNGNHTYSYDDFHQLENTTDAFGNTTSIDKVFDLVSGGLSNPDRALFKVTENHSVFGPTTQWFDHLGRARKTQTNGFNGAVFSYENFDPYGKIIESVSPHFLNNPENKVTFDYDQFGRTLYQSVEHIPSSNLLNKVDYNHTPHTGNTDPYVFRSAQYLLNMRRQDHSGNLKFLTVTYNKAGRKVKSQDALTTVEFMHDSRGNVQQTKVGNKVVSAAEYDHYGFQSLLYEVNSGNLEYRYNLLGELLYQVDQKGQEIRTHYDQFGRPIHIDRGEEFITYEYFDSDATNGWGMLKSVKSSNGNGEDYAYNNEGLLRMLSETVESDVFNTLYDYQATGILNSEQYSSGLIIDYEYHTNGELKKIKNGGNIYFEGFNKNAKGQWTSYNQMGIHKNKTYDASHLIDQVVVSGIYERDYDFDSYTNNLKSRKDLIHANVETFQFDDQDRLESVSLNGHQNMSITYFNNGNMSQKSDVGSYTYHPSKIHAITEISNPLGNINSSTQEIDYDILHNPLSIRENDMEYSYNYGTSGDRVSTEIHDIQQGVTKKRTYVNNVEYLHDVTNGELLYAVNYIGGPDGICGIHLTDYAKDSSYNFAVYTDYLGSIEKIVDTAHHTIAEQSFDAWGKRRDPKNWQPSNTISTSIPDWLWRGYTNHEHLDDFQLIHMNGRLYDPQLGRMLSPDNYVQADNLGQNYNRYSYAINNPLKYTDPSGEIFFTAATLIASAFTGGGSLALLPMAIGADLGMWQGGAMANGTGNPFKWNYGSAQTWGYMTGGAAIGAASGSAANAIANSGMAFANTAAIVGGSSINSIGTAVLSGGQADLSVGFGFGSYNLSTGEFGYLGKKGNGTMENIGYGLGALANVADALAGFNPGEVQLNTESSDLLGHSAITNVGETDFYNSIVSVGPETGGKWILNPLKFKNGTNNWGNYVTSGDDVMKAIVKGVNYKTISKYGLYLDKGVNYNLYFGSCVNHTARALTISGVPSLGIHPYILHSQMYLRSIGVRPALYSFFAYY